MNTTSSSVNNGIVTSEEQAIIHDSHLIRDILHTRPKEPKKNVHDDLNSSSRDIDVDTEHVFETLQAELKPLWTNMFHKGGAVPRLVCIQGELTSVSNRSTNEQEDVNRIKQGQQQQHQPLYRHPADEQPPLQAWTPTVRRLRDIVSRRLRQLQDKNNKPQHQQQPHFPLNHALIQLYRHGDDYISEHADKTLDIARGTNIINLSLGASRTMVLRPKKNKGADTRSSGETNKNLNGTPKAGTPCARASLRVELEHGSMFVLGWETNRLMTHEIRRDKRLNALKSDRERAFGGVRISITFRSVATFLRSDGTVVGQGAPSSHAIGGENKTPYKYQSRQEEEEALLRAFSTENRRSDYDWDDLYGQGFQIVNFKITNQNHANDDDKNDNSIV